jgi:hypothetical protein
MAQSRVRARARTAAASRCDALGEMFDLRAIAGSTSGANTLRERSAKSLARRDAHKSARSAIELGDADSC